MLDRLKESWSALERQGSVIFNRDAQAPAKSTSTSASAAKPPAAALKKSDSDPTLSDKAEKTERTPSFTGKNAFNQKKPLESKEVLDTDFDLQSEREFVEYHHDQQRWHNVAVLDFLYNKLQAYLFRLYSAKYRLAEYSSMKDYDGNIIAYKIALPKRIIELEQLVRDYQDCLDERNLVLHPTQLDHVINAKIESMPSIFNPREKYQHAIFVCHFQPLLDALSIKDLTDVIERYGRNGVNGAAGEELCKIIRMEVQRRIYNGKIEIDDENLHRIRRYFQLHYRDWHRELCVAITKRTLTLLSEKKIEEANPRVLWIIKVLNDAGLRGHDAITAAVTTIMIAKLSENAEDVFSENVQRVMSCFHENSKQQHNAVAVAVTTKVIADLHADRVTERDPKLSAMKTYFYQKEPQCHQRLDEAILQRMNTKATTFRKIYSTLFHATTHPFLSNYLQGKDSLSSQALIDQINADANNPSLKMVAVAWQLTQQHFRNVSRANKILFKEIYKASFEFSLGGMSNIAGVTFFCASAAFKTAVDRLSDQEIDNIEFAERKTRRSKIFRGLN